jgi:hypothetical protein
MEAMEAAGDDGGGRGPARAIEQGSSSGRPDLAFPELADGRPACRGIVQPIETFIPSIL